MASDEVGARLPVSVIVVTWNCDATLDACLRALSGSRPGPPEQVICVDNGSRDRSVARARANGAEVVELGSNLGFPHAVNAVLDRCTAEYVLLLNPDVVVRHDTIARCLDALRACANIGLVGANLRQPDGQPDRAAARRFRTLGLLVLETLGLPFIWRRLDLQYLPSWDRKSSRRVPCINGAFAVMRTELLREIGGLDETAFLYLEDQELSRQMAERGLEVHFEADALAVHDVSAATRAARSDQRAAAYVHRIDANVEIIRRLQGHTHARAAIVLWTSRVLVGYVTSLIRSDPDRKLRYGAALRWLARQLTGRQSPPPVPS